MPLIKAQCTNCNGILNVDSTKDAAICPFCNTPYVIEKAINFYQRNIDNRTINNYNMPNTNIHMRNMMMADTMFENWLISSDEKLKSDFAYYFPTDPRNEYMSFWTKINGERIPTPGTINKEALERLLDLQHKYLYDNRYLKYAKRDIDIISNILKKETERRKKEKVKNSITWILAILLVTLGLLLTYGILPF